MSFDPLSEQFHADPAAAFRIARNDAPVHRIEALDCWYVVSYAAVQELYTHPSFTNDQSAWKGWTAPEPGSVRAWTSENSLFGKAGADHARTRRLASHAFTPAAVRRMQDRIAGVCDEYATALDTSPGSVVDLSADFCRPIPNTVISRVLGVPPLGNDEERFRELAAAPLRLANPLAAPEVRAAAEEAGVELVTYVRSLVDARRAQGADDLVTDLVQAYDAEDRLSDDEVTLVIYALLAAGTDTTTIASLYGLRALLDNPDQLQRLLDEPALLPNAVMELLRFEVGGGALPRFALEDVEFADRQITKGDLLFLSPLAAHRDPAVFPDPDTLDIDRDTSDVIVFGHGPHYCLGANLAKMELAEIYRRALQFLTPDSRVLTADIEWSGSSLMFRRIERLPVRI